MPTKTRTTGKNTYNSLESLASSKPLLAHPSDPIHQVSNDIVETATMYQSVLDDPSVKFFDDAGDVIHFARKGLEREFGKGDGGEISADGLFTVAGDGDSEFEMTFPVDVYKNNSLVTTEGLGMTAFLRGSNKSRIAMVTGGEARVLACLNGMMTSMDLGHAKRKQTKNLSVRDLIIEGLQRLALSYHGYAGDVEALKARTITRQEFHDALWSARELEVCSSQGLGHVSDIFNGKSDSEFFADDSRTPTAWRLFNSFTRYAERQNSPLVRKTVIQGVYWPLATAGIFDLPAHCQYNASYQSLAVAGSSDDLHAPDDRQAVIDVDAIALS